jgi:TldD protein
LDRRQFLAACGIGTGGVLLPGFAGRAIAAEQLTDTVEVQVKKRLADAGLSAATAAGASYCDVRVGRYLQQSILTREATVENIVNTESSGVGVRVIADGAWGFAATNILTAESVADTARLATAIAKANAGSQTAPVQLAPAPAVGDKTWRTPIRRNAMSVPIEEKIALLMGVNAAATGAGASFVASRMFLINEQKYFASTDGSYIDQDVHRIWAPFTVTAVDQTSGKFRTRDGISAPMGMGYEYLDGAAADKLTLPNGVVVYGKSYDMIEDAVAATAQAKEKLTATSVQPGKYDLVLDPSHLGLTIHESVGHPLELDRVLGYEANYAGTSFATLDKRDAGFKYGSDIVNIVADRTQPGSLGAIGYDDEGVASKTWPLIRDGVLVDYQATRDQAHILGNTQSAGVSYADSWSTIQFQRMPNVSLRPGTAPMTAADMIGNVENGVYIVGRGSYSIDQQRYNAQFGGQLFYEIKNGKITQPLADVAYQMRTPEFWNACSATCDESDYRLFGSFFDGKGQPGQVSAVSHGSSTTRFDGINVINTARSLG